MQSLYIFQITRQQIKGKKCYFNVRHIKKYHFKTQVSFTRFLYHAGWNMWNLGKWYRWANFQGGNRDADIEKGHVDTVREGEGGTNWKTGIDMYTLPGVKHIASGKLVYRTGSSARRSVMTERGGRKVQEWGDLCIHRVDSRRCTPETNTHCKATVHQ